MQLAEAVGPVNRWYCSQAYCRRVEDPELLLVYFIKSGGAKDFGDRFEKAMGALNRWYCSEFYARDIRDPEILWDYYVNYSADGSNEEDQQTAQSDHSARMSMAS
jgi:hypothetical protein